jgi:hypothetical protein
MSSLGERALCPRIEPIATSSLRRAPVSSRSGDLCEISEKGDVVRDQSAAAEIAESKIDVRAGSSTDAL